MSHTRFWIMFSTVCQCHLCCALGSNFVSLPSVRHTAQYFSQTDTLKCLECMWIWQEILEEYFVVKQFVFLTTVQRMPDMSAQPFLSKTASQMWNNSRTLTLAAENFRYVDVLHLLTFSLNNTGSCAQLLTLERKYTLMSFLPSHQMTPWFVIGIWWALMRII